MSNVGRITHQFTAISNFLKASVTAIILRWLCTTYSELGNEILFSVPVKSTVYTRAVRIHFFLTPLPDDHVMIFSLPIELELGASRWMGGSAV